MAKLIEASNCLDAWRQVADELIVSKEIYNLIVEIENPAEINEEWLRDFNPKQFGGDNLSTVINTIFPRSIVKRYEDRNLLYQIYPEILQRGKKIFKTNHGWGTYFQRLTSFGNKNVNQLEEVIQALANHLAVYKTPYVIHISSSEYDSISQVMGKPCLQYIQIIRPTSTLIDLVAIYRNHDFFNKAFGNYVALSMLLSYICKESNKEVGKIICHSVHAYYDSSKNKLIQLRNA